MEKLTTHNDECFFKVSKGPKNSMKIIKIHMVSQDGI